MTATTTQTTTQATATTLDAEKFFSSISKEEITRESNYWIEVAPENDSECFQRFLFAFCSVHTSWEANIKAYALIKNWWEWMNRWDELESRIKQSGAGLFRNRVRFIKDFSEKFWSNPCFYTKQAEEESWTGFRNRIEKTILGLGMAKSSFAIEMMFPTIGQVFCADTHMFQLYGLNQTKNSKMYSEIEKHWIRLSFEFNVPPYIARCIYWDRKQKQQNSRYWSYVLEKTPCI
jgi:hypothetical protein